MPDGHLSYNSVCEVYVTVMVNVDWFQ